MKTSEKIDAIGAALAKAQAAMGRAKRDAENPHFKSKYADLDACWDACQGPLTSHEIAVVQANKPTDNGVTIETRLIHSSGQWIEDDGLFVPASKLDAQGFGSAETYCRRYALCAMVGIAPDDDDGNAAAASTPSETTKPEAKPVCPNCQTNEHVIKGKAEYGGGWLCWKSKGGCGEKWQDATPADTALKAETIEELKEQGRITTADKLPDDSLYQSSLKSLAAYKKVSEVVTFADWVKDQRIAKAFTVEQYADLNSKIADRAVELPTNDKGFEAAEKLLRSMHGELRISEGDYLKLCGLFEDAKEQRLAVGAA